MAVALWRSLGFRVLATVPAAFDHPDHGLVGLHLMFLDLSDAAPASSLPPSVDDRLASNPLGHHVTNTVLAAREVAAVVGTA